MKIWSKICEKLQNLAKKIPKKSVKFIQQKTNKIKNGLKVVKRKKMFQKLCSIIHFGLNFA